MLRDANKFRRNRSKAPQSEESDENLPVDGPSSLRLDSNRPPLNLIQQPFQRTAQNSIFKRKFERTPSKNKNRAFPEFRTPERPRNGGYTTMNCRKANSVQSDCSSTQSTPIKSVSKPGYSVAGSGRAPISGGRTMQNVSGNKSCSVYAAKEVQHFDLREDPSFWLDHNVQVVIRVRPISFKEQSLEGYHRCLKQESAQSITWIGPPESHFTFDYVACETISQENLFQVAGLPMIENCMSGYNSCMFAYGQTGSGKTHTMLGEITGAELGPRINRGMTPRIFEFLFARIKAEEESRRDEELKYSCKCSFLEIYNEQITDLLDPSSTNLLLREDVQKGVYVENLTEFEVGTVNDILNIIFQGTTNRKVAATNMNHESSRSHCVFTCVIESRWVKDSINNKRFARLNLVDLAGSERQKTSGAEGERLKEAANINKSLSTLGHVILVLSEAAHGKQRHVPYRDSRLTFLLQDSLGGNSKTIIIANVSPSICSANETLSTLKFAQRARLVQNNAVVNEDASGDISALQHQIRLLKEELSLLKHQNVSRSLSFQTAFVNDDVDGCTEDGYKLSDVDSCQNVRVNTEQVRSLEAALAGALRREKIADHTVKKNEAEIERLTDLVRQREEDSRCSKMMLKFREEKIQRMEAILMGQLSLDSYLMKESISQSEEIKLLKSKAERNPEVTRFASENIRLLDQLRRYQEFYEEGEREQLLNELSELRNQLLFIFDGKIEQDQQSNQHSDIQLASHLQVLGSEGNYETICDELKDTSQELVQCRSRLNSCLETNESLTREINNLYIELNNIKSTKDGHQHVNFEPDNMLVDKAENDLNLQLELDILKLIIEEEKTARLELEKRLMVTENEFKSAEERILQLQCAENELKDAKIIIEALEAQQIILINEVERLSDSKAHNLELLKKQEQELTSLKNRTALSPCKSVKNVKSEDSPLQKKLACIQASLEKAKNMNSRFQNDQVYQSSLEDEKDEIRRQVEMETTEVIVCLQEELTALQQSLICMEKENERLSIINRDNEKLRGLLEEKENKLRLLSEDWEKLGREVVEVLANGNVATEDVSESVAEQVGNIVKSITDKELLIEELQKYLNDARNVKCDLEWKLTSLRGAMVAVTEAQQRESYDRDRKIIDLNLELSEKMQRIAYLEKNIIVGEDRLRYSGMCAVTSFVIINRLSEINAALKDQMSNVEAEKELQIPTYPPDEFTTGEGNLLYAQSGIQSNGGTVSEELHNVGWQNKLVLDGEKTIALLRKELESALDSLKDVHGKISKLHAEKEEIRLFEIQSKKSIDQLTVEAARLESEIINKDKQYELKLQELDGMLKSAIESAALSEINWFKGKEKEPDFESGNARSVSVQKTSDASNLVKVEATIREAELTINALIDANKTLKSELEGHMATNTEVKSEMKLLQFCLDVEKHDHQIMERNFKRSLTESGKLFSTLECTFINLQDTFINKFRLLKSELNWIKSQMQRNTQSVKHMLEEIWSEIIGKDCAVTELHLCHMRTLLERIYGSGSEGNISNCRLSEPNLVFSDLKMRNSEAKEVLELSTVRKGKLLDNYHSFNLENETACIKNMLNSFGEKIEFLQMQEKSILERSNSMRVELVSLMKDFDASKRNASIVVSAKEQLLTEKEVLKNQLEKLAIIYDAGNRRIFSLNDRILRATFEYRDKTSKFIDELELVELSTQELISKNSYLQSEMLRKDELINWLSTDLTFLQQSASFAKNEEFKLKDSMKDLEYKLDTSVAQIKFLEDQLLKKTQGIAALERELCEIQSQVQLVSSENHKLKGQITCILRQNNIIEEELSEKSRIIDRLEGELSAFSGMQFDMDTLANERDHLKSMITSLKDQIEMAYVLAEEHDTIASEARQIAEEKQIYAGDKEEEIKLLERTVEELECTVTVLENKAETVREEAERQRLRREELEMELESVRNQMLALPASNNNTWKISNRQLKEKITELQEAWKTIQNLQREINDKDAEIFQCKTHISELNMHAEAQASEYKLKFMELEAMSRQVKYDTSSSGSTSSVSKPEKVAPKSRGSGSPFKCIGLGIVQQINSEKSEELAVSKLHIDKLESLVANQQQEIFMLNARLAAAESMTHDVIRDLLGVKLDMTSCAALLHQDHMENHNETSKFDDQEEKKDVLAAKLKKHLHKFIEERESWVNEMISAHIDLEKIQQRVVLLTTENEMIKVENAKYKNLIMELEDEIKRLTKHQNLQQRIHHHAKIKEENKILRVLNEDLHTKLERSDSVVSRLQEELSRYGAANGTKPLVDVEEEELRRKLNECEEERIHVAQKLLSLCTCILQAAGYSRPSSALVSRLEAEDAVYKMKDQIHSLETEVKDLKTRCKLWSEKNRLLELKEKEFSCEASTSC